MTEPQESEAPPAAVMPGSRLDEALQAIPRVLASRAHIAFLLGLLFYLVILPLLHVFTPSADAMLIGGNWTNVTSDMGACIAAGGTLHLVRQQRKRHALEDERLRLARETHALLHRVHAAAGLHEKAATESEGR